MNSSSRVSNIYIARGGPRDVCIIEVFFNMPISNNANAFKIHFNMMHISGVWPEESPGVLYQIRGLLSWLLGIGLSITMSMEVINDISYFTRLSEILYIMVSVTIYLVKLAGFTYQRKTFLKTLKFLKDPIFVSYPEDLDHYMAKTIRISTGIANIYRYLCLCCMLLYATFPLFDNKPLPFPFPYETGRYRYLMYAFQVASISNSAWNNSCLDTLTTSLMGIGAAQLDILMKKIEMIGRDENDTEDNSRDKKKAVREIKQCIQHHLAIIRFIESIDRIFRVGLLAQFLASILVICNTLFHFVLISATSIQFLLLANYFAIMITQLTMYCWYGNEIMWKSVLVSQACYNCKWYKYGSKTRRYLFIIMERSKRPLAVTALKFSKLSLSALTSILQWSYSYLTLLLKLYRNQS